MHSMEQSVGPEVIRTKLFKDDVVKFCYLIVKMLLK